MNRNKVYWRCSRRGMLELDIFLTTFFHGKFSTLNVEEKQMFIDFLEEEDPVLYAWLIGTAEPPSKYKFLCQQIAYYVQQTVR